jgi:hypothetical protein
MDKKIRYRLQIGDIIEVPLMNRKKGFIQYFYRDNWGDLIGVFDYTIPINDTVDISALITHKFKFYPILTRINSGFKLSKFAENIDEFKKYKMEPPILYLKILEDPDTDYNWKKIGNNKVLNFSYPNFIWREGELVSSNTQSHWYLYDGINNIDIGLNLPKAYRKYAFKVNLPAISIVNLIQFNHDKSYDIWRSMIKG